MGGGGIRNHDPNTQQDVFTALGYDSLEVDRRWGKFLPALRFGVPPHGRIAIGFDRLAALLLGLASIEEVIVLPKLADGTDPQKFIDSPPSGALRFRVNVFRGTWLASVPCPLPGHYVLGFDDQKLAYPIWEKCRELGIKNIGCHKGLPFGQFMARYSHADDFDAVADDFQDLNFIAYHSAWPYQNDLAALKAFKPYRKNLYSEMGSTFAATAFSPD